MIAAALLLSVAFPASARGWRGLEPLRSTRGDAVRRLGRPTRERDGVMRYELASETVTIDLATETAPRNKCALGVRPGTILSITVEPRDTRHLRDFGLRGSRMRKFDPTHEGYENYVGFIDSRAGVVVRTYKGEVQKIVFTAPAAIRRRCRAYDEQMDDLEGLISILIEPPVPVCVGVSAAGDVYVGDSVAVMASAATPDGTPLNFRWTSTCGRIVGSGSNVTFDATGLGEGPCTVTALIDDGFGHTVECSTTINVRARPSQSP